MLYYNTPKSKITITCTIYHMIVQSVLLFTPKFTLVVLYESKLLTFNFYVGNNNVLLKKFLTVKQGTENLYNRQPIIIIWKQIGTLPHIRSTIRIVLNSILTSCTPRGKNKGCTMESKLADMLVMVLNV